MVHIFDIQLRDNVPEKNNSKRPVDALAVKAYITH